MASRPPTAARQPPRQSIAAAIGAAVEAVGGKACSLSTKGRNPRTTTNCPSVTSVAAGPWRVATKFIQPTSDRMTTKPRPRRWASGTLSGRTSAVASVGRRRITASAATMNCQTPCWGRFAPRSDIAGHSDRAAVTIRSDAAADGCEMAPEARRAVSSARERQAAIAHRVAGTAVEPRVETAARIAVPAVTSAARAETDHQTLAGIVRSVVEIMPTSLPRRAAGASRVGS